MFHTTKNSWVFPFSTCVMSNKYLESCATGLHIVYSTSKWSVSTQGNIRRIFKQAHSNFPGDHWTKSLFLVWNGYNHVWLILWKKTVIYRKQIPRTAPWMGRLDGGMGEHCKHFDMVIAETNLIHRQTGDRLSWNYEARQK